MTRRPPSIRYPGPVLRVRFLSRPNRYVVRVRPWRGGAVFRAHLPNPGRMEELLLPGLTSGYVVPARGPGRRTRFDFVSVLHGRALVSVDTRVGNRIVREVLTHGGLPGFGAGPWKAEPRYGSSRFDFARPGRILERPRALLEVKCSNLRVGPWAFFPDAPTERGRRQLEELARAARRGIACVVLFVIQRADVRAFAPNAALDPGFARALTRAIRAGVRVRAHTVRVRPGRIEWGPRVPVVNARPSNVFVAAPP